MTTVPWGATRCVLRGAKWGYGQDTGPPHFNDSWAILRLEITREKTAIRQLLPQFSAIAARASFWPGFSLIARATEPGRSR